MAMLSGGHPWSPSGSMKSSDCFRSLALLDLVCYSTSGLSSRTSQLLGALPRYEDDGQQAVNCVFAVTLVVYLASGSRFMPCCVEWSCRISSMALLVDAGRRFESREDLPRVLGPCQSVWGCADRVKVSFHVSCGTVRRSRERITWFWWGFVPCSFHCVASCSPGFGACAFVGNNVAGKVNQRVGRSPVVWYMCVE